MRLASRYRAHWLLTPELALTGYHFVEPLGTEWIAPAPDPWLAPLQRDARALGITLFVGHPELDPASGQRHNTLHVIDRHGLRIGGHRKIQTIPISEAWSSPGGPPCVLDVDGLRVGLLVCADAWPREHATALAKQGAQLLLSAANWAPGKYGPGDCWESRSRETGLPLFVANRTGIDTTLDFRRAASVVAHRGERVFEHRSTSSVLVLLDWDTVGNRLQRFQTLPLGTA